MPSMTALSHCSSAPKYSLKGRQAEVKKAETPGPGCYDSSPRIDSKYGQSPKYGFGGSPRDSNRSSTAPGPGQYTPSDTAHKTATHGHHFGSSTRRAGSPREGSPGPGSYTHQSRVGNEGPKFSAGARRDFDSSTSSPGPAAYTSGGVNDLNMKKTPQHSFCRSTRENVRPTQAPGPGQYEPVAHSKLKKGSEYTFGVAGRKDLAQTTDPGPGSYNTPTNMGNDGPKYSAGSRAPRHLQKSSSPTPGPGTYAGDVTGSKYENTPKFGFGSSPRDGFSGPVSPGPGQYSPPSRLDQRNSPRHGFGTSERTKATSPRRGDHATPGPGTYTHSPRIGSEGPKFSAGRKQDPINSADTPGPGAYQAGQDEGHRTFGASPKFGFGTANRQGGSSTAGTPGPGTYDGSGAGGGAGERKSPAHSFGQQAGTYREDVTPGPGAYDHATQLT